MDDENVFRIIIVGDTGVGKSCILLRFSENSFKEEHNVTIGVEFGIKAIKLDGHLVKLQIWDTAGQESFRSITKSFYRRADGVILAYDVTSKESFSNCEYWIGDIKQNTSLGTPIFLIGNQVDLVQNEEEKREVDTQQGTDLANKHQLSGFLETSAKSGLLIDEAFNILVKDLLKRKTITSTTNSYLNSKVHIARNNKNKKKCC